MTNNNEETIFCGSAKQISESLTALNICLDQIPTEYQKKGSNGKVYLRLDLVRRKETDDYGNTHFIKVNTYKPENKVEDKPVEKKEIKVEPDIPLPF